MLARVSVSVSFERCVGVGVVAVDEPSPSPPTAADKYLNMSASKYTEDCSFLISLKSADGLSCIVLSNRSRNYSRVLHNEARRSRVHGGENRGPRFRCR